MKNTITQNEIDSRKEVKPENRALIKPNVTIALLILTKLSQVSACLREDK